MFKIIKVGSEVSMILIIVGGLLIVDLIAKYGIIAILGFASFFAYRAHKAYMRKQERDGTVGKHEEHMEDPRVTEYRKFLYDMDNGKVDK